MSEQPEPAPKPEQSEPVEEDPLDLDSSSPDYTEDVELVLDEKPRNVILALLKQVRPGMDLSTISLPTFVLEPRSITERFTDFFVYQHYLLNAIKLEDPVERLLGITTWFLSGWHPQARGVNKPYNPRLGEFFRCFWQYSEDSLMVPPPQIVDGHQEPDWSQDPNLPSFCIPCPDGSKTWYISEQVSHHPPITALRFENPQNGFSISGFIYTKTKFLGNSVVCMLPGDVRLRIRKDWKAWNASWKQMEEAKASRSGLNFASMSQEPSTNLIDLNPSCPAFQPPLLPRDELPYEEYTFQLPSVYGRGVVIGTLSIEMADPARIVCKQNNIQAYVDFKAKTMFHRMKNQLVGHICELTGVHKTDSQGKGPVLLDLHGDWTSHLNVTDKRNIPADKLIAGGKPICVWNIQKTPKSKKMVQKTTKQDPQESRALWSGVTAAILSKDLTKASVEKDRLETEARQIAIERVQKQVGWRQRYFHFIPERNTWRFNWGVLNGEEMSDEEEERYMDDEEKKKRQKDREQFKQKIEEKKEREEKVLKDSVPTPSPTRSSSSSPSDDIQHPSPDSAAFSAYNPIPLVLSPTSPSQQPAQTEHQQIQFGTYFGRFGLGDITAFNCPDAREMMKEPKIGAHSKKGEDVDTWVTDCPPFPTSLSAPWPTN
ncbi:putative Oxysterol-binding protein 4 [Blattamonas nauphoetae]|uniref:Oxysterol-binding protein 4 n=1 Tax=Blattamonas nauphoetae TaxID=2049346 RepID=A0ABQ9YG67_9EUKA|nr:putative Oxysterol-binding protein 4 [Blattamonas nauphoetae]